MVHGMRNGKMNLFTNFIERRKLLFRSVIVQAKTQYAGTAIGMLWIIIEFYYYPLFSYIWCSFQYKVAKSKPV